LGDDIVDVIDALKLDRPVLAGWSMGGEELSSVGSRHPEKVAGLVYLDAAYAYAFYAPGNTTTPTDNLAADLNALRTKIDLITGVPAADDAGSIKIIDGLLRTSLPQLQTDLQAAREAIRVIAETPASAPPVQTKGSLMQVSDAIMKGVEQFTAIKAPILAIFAVEPPPLPGWSDQERKAYDQYLAMGDEQIRRFEEGNPSARVVRIAHARHDVFNSHADEVQREMTAFIDRLR
jgi:pimeloyl-ACP methyl ester carboxylesterase